jgi:hypothetical protein
VLQTDLLGEIAICQLGGSLTQTAYALVSDLVTIRRRQRSAPHGAGLVEAVTTGRRRSRDDVRDRPRAELHQLVVRGVVFLDVLDVERVTFA